MDKLQNILITGGLGYVGSRIAKYLCEHSALTVNLTSHRLPLKTPSWLTRGKVLYCNVNDPSSLDKVCEGVDSIIHLASLNEIDSEKNPEDAYKINVNGTQNLLASALKNNARQFIYFSTVHVYGSPLKGELTEQSNTSPTHPYAISHLAAEKIVEKVNFSHAMHAAIFRLSNSVGPAATLTADRWTLVANQLCLQACHKKAIIVKNPNAYRNFITLDDVCRATQHLLTLLKVKHFDNCLFNLGSAHTISIIDIAKKICDRSEQLFGYTPLINAGRPTECIPFTLNIDKIIKTGFSCRNHFNKEIDKTLLLAREMFTHA